MDPDSGGALWRDPSAHHFGPEKSVVTSGQQRMTPDLIPWFSWPIYLSSCTIYSQTLHRKNLAIKGRYTVWADLRDFNKAPSPIKTSDFNNPMAFPCLRIHDICRPTFFNNNKISVCCLIGSPALVARWPLHFLSWLILAVNWRCRCSEPIFIISILQPPTAPPALH